MTITMNDAHLTSITQLQALVKLTNQVEFRSHNKEETYEWIDTILGRFHYQKLKKKERGVVRDYIRTMTSLSDAQLTRLIKQKKQSGRIVLSNTKRHTFPTTYTTDDIARLIETDTAHKRLSGPATKHIFRRMYEVFGDKRFKRLKDISVSHLYNLRGTRQYQSHTLTVTKTTPVKIPIGERRKPDPKGKPGYLRIDTVHQGDLEKEKGVYHINVVDEVTQWEVAGCVEKISEAFLAPLLESLLAQFPFVIKGFHSDCGSEYINYRVAKLLHKMLIDQTKSRARHCGDNGLVEGKNGSLIRKYWGHSHIPKKHAKLINEWYTEHGNPYFNFHRPCGFATDVVAHNGKVTKKYETYLTPFEKLKSLDNPKQYLKPDASLKCLDIIASLKDDNQAGKEMWQAQNLLYKKINGKS